MSGGRAAIAGTNGNCVEVGWRTSSYSAVNGDCVEVAPAPDRVLVRDSKDRDSPALAVPTPPGGPSCTPSPTDRWRAKGCLPYERPVQAAAAIWSDGDFGSVDGQRAIL